MRKIVLFYIMYLSICIIILCLPTDIENSSAYVEINHIIRTVQDNWDLIQDNRFEGLKNTESTFFVVDKENKIRLKSSEDFEPDSNRFVHIKNKDIIVEIMKGNVVVGKIIFINEDKQIYLNKYWQLKVFCCTFMIIAVIAMSIFLFLFWKAFLKPINRIKKDVERIAQGNLEMPLILDNKGIIGDFANSFNRLRENLLISKNNEIFLKKKNKELIASLSHDIKTPVASIQAVVELLSIQEKDHNKRNKLASVIMKAEQINLLADNLLQTTLEELEEWKVFVCEESSEILLNIISSADYKNCILPFSIPPCLINLDKNKAVQIFDNIINNSYKYANTPIKVESECVNRYLKVSIIDFGNTASDEDINLATQKFYRGENSRGYIGTGLGMYISKSLIKKMGGELLVTRGEVGGFCVCLYIPLV